MCDLSCPRFIYNAEITLALNRFIASFSYFSYPKSIPLTSAPWIVRVWLQSKLWILFPLISDNCTICTCISFVSLSFPVCCMLCTLSTRKVRRMYVQMGAMQCKRELIEREI